MEYTNVESPRWNIDRTHIDCLVTFKTLGLLPFSAHPDDLAHGAEIYARCVAGEFGPIGDYVPAPDEGPQEPSESPPPPPPHMQIPGVIL